MRRFRPLATIVPALLTLVPSFIEMLTQGLSPIVVLARFAEALGLIGTLVWLVSQVLIHYARVQARSTVLVEQGSEDTESTPQF